MGRSYDSLILIMGIFADTFAAFISKLKRDPDTWRPCIERTYQNSSYENVHNDSHINIWCMWYCDILGRFIMVPDWNGKRSHNIIYLITCWLLIFSRHVYLHGYNDEHQLANKSHGSELCFQFLHILKNKWCIHFAYYVITPMIVWTPGRQKGNLVQVSNADIKSDYYKSTYLY